MASDRQTETLGRHWLAFWGVNIVLHGVLALHRPLTLYINAPIDDGAFIRLGQNIASGQWLGPFDNFTLMKGPGYPAFLAVMHWIGIPASLAHSFFYGISVALFSAVALQFLKSRLLTNLLFLLLLWHSVPISSVLVRIVREEIYLSQALLVMALTIAAFLSPFATLKRVGTGMFAGLALGWFWLTREEGLWIVPAVALIAVFGFFNAIRSRGAIPVSLAAAAMLATFISVPLAFQTLNYIYYGKFVGVDVTETQHRRAMGAIQSVRSGGIKPFIPVTAEARKKIYEISPTFASLRAYFEGPKAARTIGASCNSIREVCGEISAGYFLWTLRQAVADEGYYATPERSSAFYRRIADEIEAACAAKRLECRKQFLSEMPPVDWRDLATRMLDLYPKAVRLLFIGKPSSQEFPGSGEPARFQAAWQFLSKPLYVRSSDAPGAPGRYSLSGWYYKSGNDWFTLTVKNENGQDAELQFERILSPDIVAAFKDTAAGHQRFFLNAQCNDQCNLRIDNPAGEVLNIGFGTLRSGQNAYDVGSANLFLDHVSFTPDCCYPREVGEYQDIGLNRFLRTIRESIISNYNVAFAPVLIAGIVSLFVTTFWYWRSIPSNACYIISIALVSSIFVRVTLLTLIEATSFLTLQALYMSSAYPLLVAASVFAISALKCSIAKTDDTVYSH